MNQIGDILDKDQSRNVSKLSSQLVGQVQQVVFTERTNLHQIGVLEIGNVGLVV